MPLSIVGGNTKHFYGRTTRHEVISSSKLSGIISYEPTELVITALAGTPLHEINKTLTAARQMLPFEPPAFGDRATLGGVVACGLSGPRRPYSGSVRDYILGVKCLTGKGEVLTFGGQVMKNVAGYDVSRLMTGAMGTLGMLLEISLKVLPEPEYEISLYKKSGFDTALENMNKWAGQSLPLSAACYDGTGLYIRLSGKRTAVESARIKLEMDVTSLEFWSQLREQQLDFFLEQERPMWRLSVPSNTPALEVAGSWLIDWGGAQRWLKSDETPENIRTQAALAGGHAVLFRNVRNENQVFHPLPPALLEIHKRLKHSFDPDRIFNRGRMYPEF